MYVQTVSGELALAWHYTSLERLGAILRVAALRPTGAGLALDMDVVAKKLGMTAEDIERQGRVDFPISLLADAAWMREAVPERPAVWFTLRDTWEPTATWRGTGSKVRFGVLPEGLTTWAGHRQSSGISATAADGLEKSARTRGSDPNEWLVSYESVPRSKWVRVEQLHGELWRPIPHGSGRSKTVPSRRRRRP